MIKDEYRKIFENEDKHFFYRANQALVLNLVKKYTKNKKPIKILDAGCGTGLLSQRLGLLGNTTSFDNSKYSLNYSKKRGVNVILGSVEKLPFKQNTFNIVVSIDVIYHKSVRSDERALSEMNRVLKPSGILILRVPANKEIKLDHDKDVFTKRRYSKSELVTKLTKAKFKILQITFINMALLPLALLSPKSGLSTPPNIINEILYKILSLENYISQYTDLPFGLGLLAIGIKQS